MTKEPLHSWWPFVSDLDTDAQVFAARSVRWEQHQTLPSWLNNKQYTDKGKILSIPSNAPRQFEPLLSAEEAAQHLRIHVKTLQRLAREQRVPSVRMGKYWRFRLSALDRWVAAQHNQTQPAVFA